MIIDSLKNSDRYAVLSPAMSQAFDFIRRSDLAALADGKYEIAFVTDVGQLKDKSFNQGTWNGVKLYAYENGLSYKYYQPANGDQATDDDRFDAMKAAAENGAKVVVCAGFLQATALEQAAKAYPEVKFVFIDGWSLGLDNVAAIAFQEEQCGYLAGYAAVMEGFTKLGFCGGGGGTNAACCRYGYGYVQGAEAAAANDAYVIGVDVDQSSQSDTVVTSALKGIGEAAYLALTAAYDGTWAETYGNQCVTMGAAQNAVGLPVDTWSLENWSVEEYEEMFQKIVSGELVIDNDFSNLGSTEHVALNIVE